VLFAAGLSPVAQQAHAINGCADGTYSVTASPDGNATSFLFNDLRATSDSNTGSRRAKCRVSAPVMQDKGYSVFAVDYRGFGVKDASQSISLSEGRRRLFDPSGPYARDFQISQRMGTKNGAPLNFSLLLTANGDPGDLRPAEMYLDSIDIAGIGFTTDQDVQQSLNSLATQRRAIMTRSYFASGKLIGLDEPLGEQGNYVATFADTDATSGLKARWHTSDAVSFAGGIALFHPGRSVADADGAVLLAASARYTYPFDTSLNAFGELGGWGSPNIRASYNRSYMNRDTLVSRQMQSAGSLFAIYARLGVAYTPDDTNQFSVSARLAHSMFAVASSREDPSNGNLFAAHVSGGTTTSDTADVMAMWTKAWSAEIDASVFVMLGHEFGNDDAVDARIDWVGKKSGSWEARYFSTVGLRLGWTLQENWALITTAGVTLHQNDEAAADWNAGLEFRTKF